MNEVPAMSRPGRAMLEAAGVLAVVWLATSPHSARADHGAHEWAGTNANWSQPLNWNPQGVPGTDDTAAFGNLSAIRTISYDVDDVTLRQLAIAPAASTPAYQINPSGTRTLSIDNESLDEITSSGGAHTISVPIRMKDSQNFAVNVSNNSLTVSGVISGPGSLTKSGGGTLTLERANTYAGSTTVSAGTLELGGEGTLGSSAFGVSVASGATLNLAGKALDRELVTSGTVQNVGAINGPVTMNGGSLTATDINVPITVCGTCSLTATGTISQPITVGGSGTLTIGGNATIGAPITLSGGTLSIGGDDRVITTLITVAGTGTINATGTTLTISGPIRGDGKLVKSGGGRLVLSGQNTFSGLTINASGGVVEVATPASLGSPSGALEIATTGNPLLVLPHGTNHTGPVRFGRTTAPGPIEVAPDPTTESGVVTLSGKVTLTTSTTFELAENRTLRLVGGIDREGGDPVALTARGAGTLVLGGERSYAGTTEVGQANTGIVSKLHIESGEAQEGAVGTIDVLATNNPSAPSAASTLTLSGSAVVNENVTLRRTATAAAALIASGSSTIDGNVTLTSSAGTAEQLIPVIVPGGRLTIAGRIGPVDPPAPTATHANRGIEKLGGGTLALNGDSLGHVRTISVKAGTLLANADFSNAPVVVPADGAGTVGGSGTVKSVSFASGAGGGVRPGGTNPGTLTVLDGATLTNTTSLGIDLAGAGATASAAQTNGEGEGDPPAAKHDVLKVNGTLTLGAARLVPRFSYTPSEGDTFVVAEAGTLSGTFGGLGEGSQLLADNHTLSVSYAGNKVTLTVLAVGEPTDDTVGKVTRLWGADRVETGIAVSNHAFPAAKSADAVVLARADLYPDALAGTPLAVKKGGPLLVTGRSALDPRVADEIERVLDLGKTVYLLGGPAALAPEVEEAVADAGYVVVRLAGETRYETAIAIATDGLGDPSTILLATGVNFPDALAGAAAASAIDGAVLLSAGDDSHPATTAYLAEHSSVTVYALGGPAARAYPSAIAVVGEDRHETATKTASELFDLELADIVGIATGTNFPDALTGGAHVGHPDRAGPLVLTHPQGVPPPTSAWLGQHAPAMTRAFVYGGPVAVSAAVVNDVAGLLDGDL